MQNHINCIASKPISSVVIWVYLSEFFLLIPGGGEWQHDCMLQKQRKYLRHKYESIGWVMLTMLFETCLSYPRYL